MIFIPNTDYVHSVDKSQKVGDYILLINPDFPLNNPTYDKWYFSDDNELWIARHRVLYGYRLHAGFVEDIEYTHDLDICCGDKEGKYEEMFEKISTIISFNGPITPFKNIPHYSKIKPYFNDHEFMATIDELYRQAKEKRDQNR